MLDLKGHLAPSTIDATVPKLLQQIRAKLPSEQLAALIGDPFNFGMLKELGVELHTFHSDPGRLAAGIKFQSERLHRALCTRSSPQANDKRHSPMHDGPLPLKQEPCSFL